MRLASHEVRWIFEGAVGTTHMVVDWFKGQRISEPPVRVEDWPEQWREDIYLVIPERADMGIKCRREPSDDHGLQSLYVELKGLTAPLGPVRFSERAVGKVEQWVKWSYEGAQVPERLLHLFDRDDQSCVLVRKKRIQRRVRLDTYGVDEEVPLDAVVSRGLTIELAQIEVAGEEFWTLGVEGFPDDSDMHLAFFRRVSAFVADFPGELPSSRTMSYAEWLTGLEQR